MVHCCDCVINFGINSSTVAQGHAVCSGLYSTPLAKLKKYYSMVDQWMCLINGIFGFVLFVYMKKVWHCIPLYTIVYQLYTNCIPIVYRIPTVYQLYTNCIPLYTIVYHYIPLYTFRYQIYQSNQHVSKYTKIYLHKPKSTAAIQNINFVDNGKVVAVLTAFISLTWLFDCLLVELVA